MADWKRSGHGPREYCRRRGISESRLLYWRRKAGDVGFVEAVVGLEPGPQGESGTWGIELVLGEMVVRFSDRPGMAREILGALREGRS